MKYCFTLSIAAVLFLASCRKDYTCECANTTSIPTGTGGSQGTTTYTKTVLKKTKKADAEMQCKNGTTGYTYLGFTVTVNSTCSLK